MNRIAIVVAALLALAGTAAAGVSLHATISLPTGETHTVDAHADENGDAGASIDGQPVDESALPESPVPLPETPALPDSPVPLPEAPALPQAPALPESPVPIPDAPPLPETPVLPEAPATPPAPTVPAAPELPAIPEDPTTPPTIPDAPTPPDTPVVPVTPPVAPTPTPERSIAEAVETVELLVENVQGILQP